MSSASGPLNRIYLTGFMGAGKSTIGPMLAQRMHWSFEDLDQRIEETTGQKIARLFALGGEANFRALESAALHDLQSRTNCVISLGGGAIETEAVRLLLETDPAGISVFLEAPLEVLLARCHSQQIERPLLAEYALLSDRYKKRRAFYQSAHLTQATENLSPEEVAAEILNRLAVIARWN